MELQKATSSDMEMGSPESEQRLRLVTMHHRRVQWVYWTVLLLGAWMIAAPATFSSSVGTALPSGGRELWLSLQSRATALRWSDFLSGVLLLIFGWRSLKPDRPISGWAVCFIGIWLTAAPLVFWAPTAVQYLNDTFVGAWLIALSVLIPGMPNMMNYMEMGAQVPPGWSYNPSSWMQRSILIALGLAGWLVSRYLAAYQLGYIPSAWDPFFKQGTELVLNSEMSQGLPVSDAGVGSLAYTLEFLMGLMGSPARWRTMPWMVALFGVLVIPLGLVHIFLVSSQPVLVNHWCTFCLLAAAIMLPMIPLEIDEVIAMGQFLRRSVRRGESFWRVFWKGGSDSDEERGTQDDRSPPVLALAQKPASVLNAAFWGMSAPWSLVAAAAIGVWLVFSPSRLGLLKPAADFNHVGGLLTVTTAVLAMGETIRMARLGNVLIGLGLAVLPLFLDASAGLWANNAACGLALAALSIPKGRIKETYGTWQAWIR